MPEMENLWSHCLVELEKSLASHQFNIWIKPLSAKYSEGTLTIATPNPVFMDFIRDRYLNIIQQAVTAFCGDDTTSIELIVGRATPAKPSTPAQQAANPSSKSNTESNEAPAAKPAAKRFTSGAASHETNRLNPLFTFDTLVTGKANQLARAAAEQVAHRPGKSYNPMLVYGGVGLGKTHLIHAIGNYIHQHNPDTRIRYIQAEKYIADVVRAYQHKGFDEFKRYYHSLDLLLVDDIQFFVGKDKTQEEFFYLFNTLVEAGKQIILTSDRIPSDIEGLQDRLKSRFSWGLTTAIEPPELEMRVAILLKKAESLHFHLDANVAFFVAKSVRSNVRELEGALNRVLAFSRFTNQAITIDAAREALKDILASGSRLISVENIQKTVADYYKIKVADMHSKKRTREIARPRQVAMSLTKELTQLSLPAIGDAFGGRDHTTVLHACRTIEAMRQSDQEISTQYAYLLQMLRA